MNEQDLKEYIAWPISKTLTKELNKVIKPINSSEITYQIGVSKSYEDIIALSYSNVQRLCFTELMVLATAICDEEKNGRDVSWFEELWYDLYEKYMVYEFKEEYTEFAEYQNALMDKLTPDEQTMFLKQIAKRLGIKLEACTKQ
jgi:hypothetical protein